MSVYEGIAADAPQHHQEYNLHVYLKESSTSEHSAGMTAMDSTRKNASDMIDKLMLMFKLTCVAIITNELIEIISGAAAQD
ncbi:hypothetical protein ACRRTK_001821 [Alexandromys fortis]